ncbi:hypothetical protein Tco_0291385 [Tanacetum coccineum]
MKKEGKEKERGVREGEGGHEEAMGGRGERGVKGVVGMGRQEAVGSTEGKMEERREVAGIVSKLVWCG